VSGFLQFAGAILTLPEAESRMEAGSEFTVTKIARAHSAEHIEQARRLFKEYAALLGIDLCFQNFETELANLPGDYGPPQGRLLLASQNGSLAGCVALRKIGPRVCEMKRLFVRPAFRGQGLGRQLINEIIREAKEIGYERMRLDTLPPQMNAAIALYRSLGFKEIKAYYNNPVAGALFMEMNLAMTDIGELNK
jgi:ribosomal protein S18 acetylase RimI-like enzyme